jgi:diguanylate cyclase (GGDEF)-like protein
MTEPFKVLAVAAAAPDLWGSSFGPFVVECVPTLAEAASRLRAEGCDAVLIQLAAEAELAALSSWPALSHAVLDAAVVVLAPEPDAAQSSRLLQLGVQDVQPWVDAVALGRLLRLAIERKRLEMAARKAYATDLATGLPNHAQLLEHMTHLVALRAREPAPMALIALRVEGLASTVAAMGVEAANVLRRKVAVRLRSGLRASDVVASTGSDTFAVLLAWIDAPRDGEAVARKLATSLSQPYSVAGRERSLQVSVGLASFPEHGERAEQLLRRALGQAASVVSLGPTGIGLRAERGPASAANDEL